MSGRIELRRVTPVVDTAAYADEDRVGAVMTFTDLLGSNRTGLIRSVVLLMESGAVAGTTSFNLWLFRTSPTIASADNAALDLTDAQLTANSLGHINIPATAETFLALSGSNGIITVQNLALSVDSTDGNLYGVLEAQGAVTFTAADDLTVVLGVEQVG